MGFLFFSNSLKLTNMGRENTVSLFAECWEKSFVDLFLLKFFILQWHLVFNSLVPFTREVCYKKKCS